MSKNSSNFIIFGGCGFIGTHLATFLLEKFPENTIYLADIVTSPKFAWPKILTTAIENGKVVLLKADVRQSLLDQSLPDSADVIFNLAAVHKQPGHEPNEYFDTNIPGAKNVCAYAEQIECKQIVFTSSIAVYGSGQDKIELKTEQSTPAPNSPYGSSKLEAERIHLQWANSDRNRKMIIVRPGVIFGHGEAGNVTRMIQAIKHYYFFFIGNQGVSKAGGYVKELCHSILWMMDKQRESENSNAIIYNFTLSPAPIIAEFARVIAKTLNRKAPIPSAPFTFLYWLSFPFKFIAKLIGINSHISPERIIKLKLINPIEPQVLKQLGYKYSYSLDSSFQDWKKDWPSDWQ